MKSFKDCSVLHFCRVNVWIHNSCPSNRHRGWADHLHHLQYSLLSPPHLHPWLGGSSNTIIIYLLCTCVLLFSCLYMVEIIDQVKKKYIVLPYVSLRQSALCHESILSFMNIFREAGILIRYECFCLF